jgi:hypothetical protein
MIHGGPGIKSVLLVVFAHAESAAPTAAIVRLKRLEPMMVLPLPKRVRDLCVAEIVRLY